MSADILVEKLEEGSKRGRKQATWNTRRLPSRLTPDWTNRLFGACEGKWRGYFPLSGDVLWNPEDEAAPYTLIFDLRRWQAVAPIPAPRFRSWRYLEPPPEASGPRA